MGSFPAALQSIEAVGERNIYVRRVYFTGDPPPAWVKRTFHAIGQGGPRDPALSIIDKIDIQLTLRGGKNTADPKI